MCVRGEKSTLRSSLSSLLWQARPIRNHLLSLLHPWQATSISLLDTVKGCSAIWCRRLGLLISVRENWCFASERIRPVPELRGDVLGYAECKTASPLLLMRCFPSFGSLPRRESEYLFLQTKDTTCTKSMSAQEREREDQKSFLSFIGTPFYSPLKKPVPTILCRNKFYSSQIKNESLVSPKRII